MLRVDQAIITYHLMVDLGLKPVTQRMRYFSNDCRYFVKKEVDMLLVASYILEVKYPG